MIRAAILTALLLVGMGSAQADTHYYYAPTTTDSGIGSVEAYMPQIFDGPRVSGAALADAALKELGNALDDAKAIDVAYNGTRADITIAADKLSDANVADRALGAVFHTLRMAGFSKVSLGRSALTAASFTRAAYVPIVPIVAALPPQRVVGAYVVVGDNLVDAARFYDRLKGGDKAIQAAATAQLESGSSTVKLALLGSVDELRLKDRDGVVLGRLGDNAPAVRLAALGLLKRVKSKPQVVKALESLVASEQDTEVNLAAVRLLVDGGKTGYRKYLLVDKLRSDDPSVVIEACAGLVKTGDAKFTPAIAALGSHSDPAIRMAAVDSLAKLQQYGAMAKWLADDTLNDDVREKAARILTDKAKGSERARGISWLVQYGSEDNALHAAGLVEKESTPGTTTALGLSLGRPEAKVRLASASALGALKDTAGLESLAKAYQASKDNAERDAFTAQATAIIGVQPLDQVIKISQSPDLTIRELAIKSLAAFSAKRPNKKAIRVLEEALSETTPAIRQAAAYALARIQDDGIARKLAAMSGDKDPLVRAQVATAVAGSKLSDADAILTKYLDDRDSAVKVAAVRGVRTRKIAAAQDKVRWLVTHRQIEVRREAMRTLLALSKPADASLFDIYAKAMIETDNDLRMMAIDGLGQFKDDSRASAAIGGAVADDRASKDLKRHALKALSALSDPDAVEHVVRGLFDEDKNIKLATLDALQIMASDKASRPLQEFVLGESDKDVKARAEQVLDSLP